MGANIQTEAFSYEALDPSIRGFVQHKAREIQAHMQRSAEDIMVIGQALLDVKAQLGHGHFLAWIEAEFSMSYRTAARFMSVAERFAGKSDSVAHLPVGVLYMLSSGKVSDEVVDQVASGQLPASAVRNQKKRTTYSCMQEACAVLLLAWVADEDKDRLLRTWKRAMQDFIADYEDGEENFDPHEALFLAIQAIEEAVESSED